MKIASDDQVAFFKIGAAARYKELGIPPKVADELFTLTLYKIARELGFAPAPDEKIKKVAAFLKKRIKK